MASKSVAALGVVEVAAGQPARDRRSARARPSVRRPCAGERAIAELVVRHSVRAAFPDGRGDVGAGGATVWRGKMVCTVPAPSSGQRGTMCTCTCGMVCPVASPLLIADRGAGGVDGAPDRAGESSHQRGRARPPPPAPGPRWRRRGRAARPARVPVGERLHVEECDAVRVRRDDLGGNLAGDDAAEDAAHPRPSSGPGYTRDGTPVTPSWLGRHPAIVRAEGSPSAGVRRPSRKGGAAADRRCVPCARAAPAASCSMSVR